MRDDFGSDIAQQIIDMVDSALDSRNYEKLSAKINNILNPGGTDYRPLDHMKQQRGRGYQGQQSYYSQMQQRAMNGANSGRAAYEQRRQNMMNGAPHLQRQDARQQRILEQQEYNRYFGQPQGETLGTVLFVLGIIGLATNGIGLLMTILGAEGGLGTLIARLISIGISGGMFGVGAELKNRAGRFRKYASILKGKLYSSIAGLAKAVGKSEDFVRSDLKKMIGKGLFKQGHLDTKETTMIASDALYEQYLETQRNALERERAQEEAAKQYGGLSEDVKKVLKTGDEYIEKIREANAALPAPDITEKLSRLEMVISRIFARVKEEPSEARNLSQFMDYYLPTTWKLVAAYREMEEQKVQGENILTAKREILESLDTINDAFETLLDSMFKDKAWDVSTDISVMKSMMKQEGLTGSDFSVAQGGAAAMKAPEERAQALGKEK